MITRRRFSCAALSAVLVFFGVHGAVGAQTEFPSKPIRIIYPAAPGGGVESLVRQIADKMSDKLGQTVLVENKPGANTQIGVDYVARSAPDGYTLGVGFVTNLALAPHVYKKLPYDPLEDLTPIRLMALNYLALASRPDAPFANIEDMGKWAKSKPNGINVGATSVGGLPHLAFEQLAHEAGLQFTIVSYNGNSQLLQDLMGGRLDVAMVDYTGASQFIEAGKLKLIGITKPTRDPRHPELPTISEFVPGYQSLGWFGFIAAAETPDPIVDVLNGALTAAIAHPDVQQTIATFGLLAAPESSEEFAKLLEEENQKYGRLVKDIGFKPQ